MNLGDLLDGGFKLFLANWRTLLLISGMLLVPVHLAAAFLQRDIFGGNFLELLGDPAATEAFLDGGGAVGSNLALLVSAVAGVVILPFVAGAVCKVVASSYLGERLDWGPALRASGRRFWALIGSWVLVHLLQLVPYLPALLLLAAAAVTGNGGLVLGGVLLLLLGALGHLAVMPLFVAVAPAVVAEDLGPIAALRRSARLLRPRYWQTLGAALLAGLMVSFLGQVISTVPTVAGLFAGGEYGWVFVGIGGILNGLVSTPLIAIIATLIYFDGRIRQEGFDLELMAAELGGGGGPDR
ncbi:hypothetical protein BH23ACT7_BH23ACT7_02820 [soil metagenome]